MGVGDLVLLIVWSSSIDVYNKGDGVSESEITGTGKGDSWNW